MGKELKHRKSNVLQVNKKFSSKLRMIRTFEVIFGQYFFINTLIYFYEVQLC